MTKVASSPESGDRVGVSRTRLHSKGTIEQQEGNQTEIVCINDPKVCRLLSGSAASLRIPCIFM